MFHTFVMTLPTIVRKVTAFFRYMQVFGQEFAEFMDFKAEMLFPPNTITGNGRNFTTRRI